MPWEGCSSCHTYFGSLCIILYTFDLGPISLKVVPQSLALLLYICFVGHVCSIHVPNFFSSCIYVYVLLVFFSLTKLLALSSLRLHHFIGGDEELKVEMWRG